MGLPLAWILVRRVTHPNSHALIKCTVRADAPACTVRAPRFLPRFDIWTMRSMDRKIPIYLRGFSFGPCFDFLGRKRIRGSSFIGHHSLKSFSVLIRDALRGNTYQLFVSQPGANTPWRPLLCPVFWRVFCPRCARWFCPSASV